MTATCKNEVLVEHSVWYLACKRLNENMLTEAEVITSLKEKYDGDTYGEAMCRSLIRLYMEKEVSWTGPAKAN